MIFISNQSDRDDKWDQIKKAISTGLYRVSPELQRPATVGVG